MQRMWMISFGSAAFHERNRLLHTVSTRSEAASTSKQRIEKMRRAIDMLRTETLIPQIYKDHPLKGNWRGRREMHIAPDWLLIYHIENDTVYLDRTGSHAELLKR